MVRHPGSARRLWLWGIIVGLTLGIGHPASAQRPDRPASDDPAAAEEVREQRATQRFLSLLEKNPRRGTALDRVYGYHVERGTLDAFIKSERDRTAKDPKDGTAWLILGLLEFQRGQDAAAVAALRQAETHRPQDALPAYYLGQALVLVGQPEQAADAFERALQRKPPRNDLMEIFQALGASTSAPRRTIRRSRSGAGSRPCSPTMPASRSRSPRHSPRRTSPPRPCPATRRWRRRSPTRSARCNWRCRPPS